MANKLVQTGWHRVNQDEMGTRKACEASMEQALRKGQSIIVDRCNFDILQRHTWFKLASKYNVKRVDSVFLDIDPEVCKQRISSRKDHPTIPENSQEAPAIIDNFKKLFINPSEIEGFATVSIVKSNEEADKLLEQFVLKP